MNNSIRTIGNGSLLNICRIQCFTAGLKDPNETGRFVRSITDPRFGRVFAISYDKRGEYKMYQHIKILKSKYIAILFCFLYTSTTFVLSLTTTEHNGRSRTHALGSNCFDSTSFNCCSGTLVLYRDLSLLVNTFHYHLIIILIFIFSCIEIKSKTMIVFK